MTSLQRVHKLFMKLSSEQRSGAKPREHEYNQIIRAVHIYSVNWTTCDREGSNHYWSTCVLRNVT